MKEEFYLGSFAFYFDKENSSTKIDVHFNLWNQCGWNETFLDIGVMLHKVKNDCKLYIRFPFKFSGNDLISLENALDNTDTLSVIFNESCTKSEENQSNWILVSCGDGKHFYIYKMSINDSNRFALNILENDTVATISIPHPPNNSQDDVYIRFRVKISQDTSVIRSYDRPYKFIRGIFQKNYIIDFRYNDKRSFSKNTIENMKQDKVWAKTSKIHFLLMSKAAVNVECGGSVRKRMLEGNAWSRYLDGQKVSNDIIAYHATTKSESDGNIDSWEFFAKQNVEVRDKWMVLAFISVTVIIGVICGVVGNVFYAKLF